MDEEIATFRARVAALKRGHRGTPYPADVRKTAVRLAAALRAGGLGPYAVGRKLGIRAETLSSWSEEETGSGFVSVFVHPERVGSAAAAPPPASEIVVVSPSGWRIEGIGLSELERLVRVLR
jgi:hypothetical protein